MSGWDKRWAICSCTPFAAELLSVRKDKLPGERIPPRQGTSNTFVSATFRRKFQNTPQRLSPRESVDLPGESPNVNCKTERTLPVSISRKDVQSMLTLNPVLLQSAESSCTFFTTLCLTNLPLNPFISPPSVSLFQVKVMMRICPSLGATDSSESQSFLKVDSRKKQLTLYDPASSPHSGSGHRRSATVAVPKIFAFDAVFTQDASQVRPSLYCRTIHLLIGIRLLKGETTFLILSGCGLDLEPGSGGKMPVLGQRAFLPAWGLTAGTFKPSGELLESTPVISHLPFHWTAISNLRPLPPTGRHAQPDQTQRSHICLRFGKLAVVGGGKGSVAFPTDQN